MTSSSSSSSGSLILDNLELFRGYSLDPDLIELYFNKGVDPDVVDLEPPSSSSSSSSEAPFSLDINIAWESYPEFDLPDDIQIYPYDQTVNDFPVDGVILLELTGPKTLRARFQDGYQPDPSVMFSFRINVESDYIATSRLVFRFYGFGGYSYDLKIQSNLFGERGRLTSGYKQYLLQWIIDFWASWDANDQSLIPDFTPPFPKSFIPFDPFGHARWRLLSDLSQQTVGALADYTDDVQFEPGNKALIEGKNFLSVNPQAWKHIGQSKGALYDFKGYPYEGVKTWEKWWNNNSEPYPRNWKDPDISFDCRSFAMIGASYLRKQLAEVCPQAEVKVMSIKSHYVNWVNLNGEAPCCKGKFIWEPQNGVVYDNPQQLKDAWGIKWPPKPPVLLYEPGKENSDGDFGDPNWENSPAELYRMAGVVCANVRFYGGDEGRDKELKDICDQQAPEGTPEQFQILGAMPGWLGDNLSFSPGVEQPALDPPQDCACNKCLLTWRALWNCSDSTWTLLQVAQDAKCVSELPPEVDQWVRKDQADPCELTMVQEAPAEAYTGASMCDSNSFCKSVAFNAPNPQPPPNPQECIDNWCVEGAWCEINPSACNSGTKLKWRSRDNLGVALSFDEGASCGGTDGLYCQEKIKSFYIQDYDQYSGNSPWG